MIKRHKNSLSAPITSRGVWLFIILFLLSAVVAGPAAAEEPEPIRPEPDAEQSDIYYSAMLKSIELDKNRWKSFSRSLESGPWFYDTQSVKRKGATVTAQVTVFPHPNKTELYKSVFQDHTKIRKIIFGTEINCSAHTYRQPTISVYGYFGELLAEHAAGGGKPKLSPIKPSSTIDTLQSLICAPDRKKRR